jgi:hypothetical protein
MYEAYKGSPAQGSPYERTRLGERPLCFMLKLVAHWYRKDSLLRLFCLVRDS